MTDIPSTGGRAVRVLSAALAVAFVAFLTLAPQWIVAPARAAFLHSVDVVSEPLIGWAPYAQSERILNTALFVPLGATVALLLRRRAWPVAVLVGAALSATVEYAQSAIPGRVPDAADVVWNTVGAAIGVAVVTLPRLIAASARGRRDRRGGPQRGSATLT